MTGTPETNPDAQRPQAIRVEALSKAYGRTPVLRGLSLEVPWGETLSVVGPNGAGKTTLIRVLAGLTKPDKGSVEIAGLPLDRMGRLARRVVGVVTHEPLLYDGMTVRENLRFAGRMFSLDRLDGRVESAADRLGVRSRLDEKVGTLSHGLRKRVSIARALLHEPSILLMDEPETGLDRQALGLLESVVGEVTATGGAVVMTTHSLAPAVGSGRRLTIVAGAAHEEAAAPQGRVEP